MGLAATLHLVEVAHDPARFAGDRTIVAQEPQDAAGRATLVVRVDDDGGLRLLRMAVWRGARGALSGLTDRLRTSPGIARWDTAQRLLDAGISTPRPLLAAERRDGAIAWSCFANEFVDAAVTLENILQWLPTWTEPRQIRFLRSLGRELAKMRTLSVKDLSASMFLVRGIPDFEFVVYLTELDGSGPGGKLSDAQLESRILFGLSPKAVSAFFAAYRQP